MKSENEGVCVLQFLQLVQCAACKFYTVQYTKSVCVCVMIYFSGGNPSKHFMKADVYGMMKGEGFEISRVARVYLSSYPTKWDLSPINKREQNLYYYYH